MINKLVELSEKLSNERKQDPELSARMEVAAQGQSPRFLLISPINRSSQDLQLFGMKMGDAFHGTRVPGMPLLPPQKSRILFAGPAAYNQGFPEKRGVILTFEQADSDETIHQSIESVWLHPDLTGIPIIAFRVNYDVGSVRIIVHGKGRSYETENWLLSRVRHPDPVDSSTLVLICSDSRVQPPVTPEGLPMAIQTLGGYVPRYSEIDDETRQLDIFFKQWLDVNSESQEIIIIAHGNFEGEGPSCGAGQACLHPERVKNDLLRPIIEELQIAAQPFESKPAEDAETRVKSLCSAIRENLLSYPSIQDIVGQRKSELINTLLMDTVSNVLSTIDI
jgi:carbonic anhydrase